MEIMAEHENGNGSPKGAKSLNLDAFFSGRRLVHVNGHGSLAEAVREHWAQLSEDEKDEERQVWQRLAEAAGPGGP